jgi:hypothetical protein
MKGEYLVKLPLLIGIPVEKENIGTGTVSRDGVSTETIGIHLQIRLKRSAAYLFHT